MQRVDFLALFMGLTCLQACSAEPPTASNPTPAISDIKLDEVVLPKPVEATYRQLVEQGEIGTYRSLARLAAMSPSFVSNYGGVNHLDFWYLKYRTGDWPTRQLQAVLRFPHGEVSTPQGRVYVWPYLATVGPRELTADIEREMTDLVGDWQADAIRAGQPYQGYRVGIREDGVWLYFVAGEGL